MNSVTALAMFYAAAQVLVEQQGCAATLQRLDFVREWLERINENNGGIDPCKTLGQGLQVAR